MIAVAVFLVGWSIWLGSTLPANRLPQKWSTAYIGLDNYSLTWVGLDCIEALGLAWCGRLFRHASPASRTIALLVIPVFVLDAWFDIMTSVSKTDLLEAIVVALFAELPTATALGWVAWKAKGFEVEPTTA